MLLDRFASTFRPSVRGFGLPPPALLEPAWQDNGCELKGLASIIQWKGSTLEQRAQFEMWQLAGSVPASDCLTSSSNQLLRKVLLPTQLLSLG